MGNANSSGAAGGEGPGGAGGGSMPATRICYYELLAVERSSTQEEIKKAYKKKALELHPDRNYNDVDNATRLFAEVQAAYEVLSDPQERAWYDSHRDAILHGEDPSSTSGGAADGGASSGGYTRTTTSAEVLSWFSLFASKANTDYSDSPNGFFTVLSSAFTKLANEEAEACVEQGLDHPYFPTFGGSKSGYEDHVRAFYAHWMSFKTCKDFAWCDVYRLGDAPDRRYRRAMEKENMKLRETAKREFEDNIREFVKFIRKRDPRYVPPTVQSEDQRHAAMLARSKEQAARTRAANAKKQAEYQAADWTQVNHDNSAYLEEFSDGQESEEEEKTVFECVVCKKIFKTEGQSRNHEKSKQHQQAVWKLKKEMEREDRELGLGGRRNRKKNKPVDKKDEKEDEEEEEEEEEEDSELDSDHVSLSAFHARISGTKSPKRTTKPSPSTTTTPIPPTTTTTATTTDDLTASLATSTLGSDDEPSSSTKPKQKLGAAKAKREKRQKAAAAAAQGSGGGGGGEGVGGEHSCVSCHKAFGSKTKLFNHLKSNPGHAAPVPKGGTAGAGAGAGGKKGKRK
ncbi:hypothetical protein DFH27DRAFT_485258 [Peziza echinospora]|nr:hypothetical protein DFH27DRAFT_485258 [Peziza echinospora]